MILKMVLLLFVIFVSGWNKISNVTWFFHTVILSSLPATFGHFFPSVPVDLRTNLVAFWHDQRSKSSDIFLSEYKWRTQNWFFFSFFDSFPSLGHDHLKPKSLPRTAAHLLMMLDRLVEEKAYVFKLWACLCNWATKSQQSESSQN